MNKGMPFWEQHLEKMVLGLSVVVLLAVFAMLVLGTSDITADIDGRSYGPAEVDSVMVEKAQELGRRLSPDASADVEAFAAIDATGAAGFAARLKDGVSPRGTLPRLGPALAASLLPEDVGSVDVWYWEPTIPAPSIHRRVMQTIDTIEPSELDRVEGLSSMIAANGDVIWTTPRASLDLDGIRRELARENTRSDPMRSRIPSNWYNDRPYVLDLVFERQTLGADGAWSKAEVIGTMPGAVELRSQIEKARKDDSLNANFKEFVWVNLDDKVKQLEILQPDFYATVNSRFSISAASAADDDAAESGSMSDADAAVRQQEAELQRRIKDKASSATSLEATLQELGGPLREDEEGGSTGGSAGGSRGGRGSSGGRGGPPGGDPNGGGIGPGSGAGRKTGSDAGSAADRRRRIRLTLQLERLQSEIARLREQLGELNPDAADVELEIDPSAVLPDLAQADELDVWTHDLDVVPGETYRYRCRVMTFNPFFARGRQLLPDQQSLAEPFELASGTSDWTDPVTIDPPVEFFVVRGTDGTGSLGLGETRVELYRYFEGAVRKATFTLQPGERIGRPLSVDCISVDFSTDWYVVDIVADPAAPEERGYDREANATVLCRRIDGSETRVLRPSEQDGESKLAQYRVDA